MGKLFNKQNRLGVFEVNPFHPAGSVHTASLGMCESMIMGAAPEIDESTAMERMITLLSAPTDADLGEKAEVDRLTKEIRGALGATPNEQIYNKKSTHIVLLLR